MLWRRRGVELLAVALVAAAAFFMASLEIRGARERGEKPYFYQSYYEPAVRIACGQPFGIDRSEALSPEMRAFLNAEQDSLSCEHVPLAKSPDPDPPIKIWYHTFVATGTLWSVTGISWSVIDHAAAFLVSLTAVFVHALFRLWMPPPVAGVLALVSVWPAMRFGLYQRDLNKAPFILGAVFVVGLLVSRRLSRPAFWATMAGAGLWLGVGYGFRPDVLIVLPLLVVAAVGFRPKASRREWLDGCIGALLLIAAFRLAAAPALPAERTNVGSCHWHFALLGLSDVHTQTLGLEPGNVSWLSQYSDELLWRTVEAYAQRTIGPSEVGFCTAEYDRSSFAMYAEVLRTFPRDLASRGFAAMRQLVDYGLWSLPIVDGTNPLGERLLRHRSVIRNVWLYAWLPLLVGLLAYDVRAGGFAILAFVYLCAYPAVQFDPRHFFHLAFLTWAPVGILVAFAWRTAVKTVGYVRSARRGGWREAIGLPPAAAWRRAVAVLLGGGIAVAGILSIAAWVQRDAVESLFAGYVAADGGAAPVASREEVDGRTRISFAGFAPETDRRFAAKAMRLALGGPACPPGARTISAGVSGLVDGPLIRKEYTVRIEQDCELILFLPFHYKRFQADLPYAELASEDVACLRSAEWVDSRGLPSLWVSATIVPQPSKAKLPGDSPSG